MLEVAHRPDDVMLLMSTVADRGLCSSHGRSQDGESETTAARAAGETDEAATDEEEADRGAGEDPAGAPGPPAVADRWAP